MTGAITPLLWFIAIVAMIPLVLWLMKRTQLGGLAAAGGGMRMVSVLPLSPGQKLVTVEVGTGDDKRWLVLGVTAQNIATLHSMAPQAVADGTVPPPLPGFAQLLGKLRKDPRDER